MYVEDGLVYVSRPRYLDSEDLMGRWLVCVCDRHGSAVRSGGARVLGMSYPFSELTESELNAFVAEPRHAIVATLRKDGSVHLSPVWFLYEGGRVYFAIQPDSAKHRHLSRDPRVTVCVDAGFPDARSVTFSGSAEVQSAEQSPEVSARQFRVARRYLDSDEDTERYLLQAQASGGLVLVAVSPDTVLARDYN